MGAYAYCDKCDSPIQISNYTVKDIVTGTYECTQCQTQNVVLYSLEEFLQSLVDRVTELESNNS